MRGHVPMTVYYRDHAKMVMSPFAKLLWTLAANASDGMRLYASGMTKYRKGPTKDHKRALHRTTEDRQYRNRPTKDCKGTLRAKLQEIGTN